MKIIIEKDWYTSYIFSGDQYVVDLDRRFEGYQRGDLICNVCPFGPNPKFPLQLEIAIRADGSLAFRNWSFTAGSSDQYMHTCEPDTFVPTAEQIDTVNGLFSGRIKFDGLKIAVGATVQKICPIDVAAEEKKIGEKIYLA